MAKDKEKKAPKEGEDLKNSTIFVLTLGVLFLGIFIYFGLINTAKPQPLFVLPGVLILALCILCTLPNLKAFFRGKRREHLIKTGKLKEAPKKSYNPNSRFDDNE